MFDFTLTPEDRKWLVQEHPSLIFSNDLAITTLSGVLRFDMAYENKEGSFIIFPQKYDGDGIRIKDSYEIKILFQKGNISELPQVFETGSRIKNLAEERSRRLSDFHLNGDQSVCLCVVSKEREYFPDGFKIKTFFNQLLIPFFYAQTYFQQYNKWPWGEYSHGGLGIVEYYLEKRNDGNNKELIKECIDNLKKVRDYDYVNILINKNKIKGHRDCFCRSKLKLRNCHKRAFQGLWHLKEDLRRNGIILTRNS